MNFDFQQTNKIKRERVATRPPVRLVNKFQKIRRWSGIESLQFSSCLASLLGSSELYISSIPKWTESTDLSPVDLQCPTLVVGLDCVLNGKCQSVSRRRKSF